MNAPCTGLSVRLVYLIENQRFYLSLLFSFWKKGGDSVISKREVSPFFEFTQIISSERVEGFSHLFRITFSV